jgi:hypothetical protein
VHSRLPLAWREQLTLLGFYLNRPEGLPLAWRNQRTVLGLAFARSASFKPSPSSTLQALEFGPTEILPPVGAI